MAGLVEPTAKDPSARADILELEAWMQRLEERVQELEDKNTNFETIGNWSASVREALRDGSK